MAVQFNGTRFKSMVVGKNWKLKDLAEKMDLNPQTLSNWANGSLCYPQRLIEALGIIGYSTDEIMKMDINDFYTLSGAPEYLSIGTVLELSDKHMIDITLDNFRIKG